MNNQDDFFDDIISDEISDEFEADDFAPDEELDEDDDGAVVRTVVLAKNEMLALLSLKSSADASVIVRVDPRQPIPAAKSYDDAELARKWFNHSLATSRKNGWEIIFDGEPLFG